MTTRLTRRQAAILGAYTAQRLGPFSDVLDYMHTLKGWEQADQQTILSQRDKVKAAAKADAIALAATLEDDPEAHLKPTQEMVDAIDQARVERFDRLINALYARFPKVDGLSIKGTEQIEVVYLQAIDKLLESTSQTVTTYGHDAAHYDTEALLKQAIESLMPPVEKKDPHAATVRKVLNSVFEAYEKLKQAPLTVKQTQEVLGSLDPIPVASVADALALYTERKDGQHE